VASEYSYTLVSISTPRDEIAGPGPSALRLVPEGVHLVVANYNIFAMCGGEGTKSGFKWRLSNGKHWPNAQKLRIICQICHMLSCTEHGKITMTLKELRQSSLLGCMACHALSQGTRAIVKKPGTTARRDSMISQDEHFGDVDRTNITAMGYEQTIDELELNYQIDPSFECPLNLGGWYVRCGCTDAVRYCRHKEYHLDIDVFTVPGEFQAVPIYMSKLLI
jgi:hypothetical protein